ncbi:MAG: M48 family metallopeptidase [Pseudomonadota bacterium]
MSDATHYPESPRDVPQGLTRATGSYRRQAWLAMAGLLTFILFYLALTASFAIIAYNNFRRIQAGDSDFFHIVVTGISVLLTIFLVKSLFTVRKSGDPGGVEVTADDEPVLFDFLHRLADEIGAPKPHRVFITPEVNAAVFYDLSLINLIFPSKKNLIVGLGLVNVLNLGELKAVLAHEFGHFAQGAMAVGRWVYVAQQIISHMVATRDWLDSVVRFIGRIDIRIAWIGWILALVIWSIRSLMDTLFSIVIMAERALSREMEFNADLVAVSVTGSDALVNALHKLQAADEAWQTTLDIAGQEAGNGKRIGDLFDAQLEAVSTIGRVLNDDTYGKAPEPDSDDAAEHRVFTEQMATPPQMWSTHPPNRDREDNAKGVYVPADIDSRSAWLVFKDPPALREQISRSFYNADKIDELDTVHGEEAVTRRFNKASLSSEFRGTYLSRSPVRNFASVDEMLECATLQDTHAVTHQQLYPEAIAERLEQCRSLDAERHTLEALAAGDLKPSGGVIRHRGEELDKSDIPDAIEQVAAERKALGEELKTHDANCRQAHLAAAKALGQGWDSYLLGLVRLLHSTEHLHAVVSNEQALLVNTWQVITADGQIGYFEKKRMLGVCNQVQQKLREVSSFAEQIVLPAPIASATGIDNWAEKFPKFAIDDVTKDNWVDWCRVASQIMDNLTYALGIVRSAALEEMIKRETAVAKHSTDGTDPGPAPDPGNAPSGYPTLLPGQEHVLQRKLDLWNRFQLAHGFGPATLRAIISIGIVGGAIYGGVIGF